jgi:site-specific recombinase XerD
MVIQEYISWKASSRPRAAENYKIWLLRFKEFIGKDLMTAQLSDAVSFVNRLESRGLSLSTRAVAVIALRDFYKFHYLLEHTKFPFSLLKPPDVVSKHYEFLTQEEVDKILYPIGEEKILDIRDKAMISFLSDTGVRASELMDMNSSDINLSKMNATILTKKSHQYRMIFWHGETHRLLKLYLWKRNAYSNAAALWLSFGTNLIIERLSKRTLERMVKTRAKIIDYKNIVVHSFRHKLAHELLENGATNSHIQAILGHNSILSTEPYTHLTNPEMENFYYRFTRRGQTYSVSKLLSKNELGVDNL